MGAWIEIVNELKDLVRQLASHPTWVRGLKFLAGKIRPEDWDVAPHVGAWIEIDVIFHHF